MARPSKWLDPLNAAGKKSTFSDGDCLSRCLSHRLGPATGGPIPALAPRMKRRSEVYSPSTASHLRVMPRQGTASEPTQNLWAAGLTSALASVPCRFGNVAPLPEAALG